MPGFYDLEVDTVWIRTAAATLGDAATCFGAEGGIAAWPPLASATLGPSESAIAAALLVVDRNSRAHAACVQMQAISDALVDRLDAAADQFDRAEDALRMPDR